MKRKYVLLFSILFFVTGFVHAQRIDSLMLSYNKKIPQEKIHIHFDNSLYVPGQTVWFKAYLLKEFEPSEISKSLYIDWSDESGKLITRTISPILNGFSIGDFTVPQKYSGTRLQVTAYTKWMLNFDSAFLFHQVLPVAQPPATINRKLLVIPTTSLQFFPEGGELVENITGNIAFKALNSEGTPVNVSGTVYKKNGEVLTTFITEHDGMGKFPITPLPNETYTAEWKDPQGNTHKTVLPAATNSGLVVTMLNQSSIRGFSIERPVLLQERFKRVTIVASINQQVVFRASANLSDKNKITASLPGNSFPSGVLRLTIFDAYMQPVTERVLFMNNDEYRMEAEILTETLNLEKRGKNEYQIQLTDTIPANFSIAVTEGDGLYDSSRNIISQLLLSADLKGQVYNPAYYFTSQEDSVARFLDLVMLTNGWRKFVWNDVLTGTTPALRYERDSNYLSIAGKIDRLSDDKIKKAEIMNLILVAKDSSKQYMFTPIRPDGSFREDNLILFDTTKIYYKLNNVFLPGRSHVTINNSFLAFDASARHASLLNYLPDTTGMAHIRSIADEQRKLDSLQRLTTLKEVVVRTRAKTRLEEMDDTYATGMFQLSNSHNFNVVDDPAGNAYRSPLDYLRGKVAGLQIIDTNGVPRVTRRGNSVAFFINEVPTDLDNLLTMSMGDIAYIKVLDPPFMGARLGGSGGAISIYMKKGGDEKTISPGLDYTLLPGYTAVRQFYSPAYAEKQVNFSKPDLRRTVYWKPDLLTDGVNKKISISFYNNDISRSLQLVLEGMSSDGKLLHISRLLR